jgi:hypothetical protein
MKHLYIAIGVGISMAAALSGCGGGGSSNDMSAPPVAATPPPPVKTDLTAFVTTQMTTMPQSMEPADSVEPTSLDGMDFSADEEADADAATDAEISTAFHDILVAE